MTRIRYGYSFKRVVEERARSLGISRRDSRRIEHQEREFCRQVAEMIDRREEGRNG